MSASLSRRVPSPTAWSKRFTSRSVETTAFCRHSTRRKVRCLKKNGGRKKTKCIFVFVLEAFCSSAVHKCCPHVPPYIHLTDQRPNKRNDSEYPLKEQSVLSLLDEAVMSPVQFFFFFFY